MYEEKLYGVRSLVVIYILNFQRDLVMRFIRIDLIICSTNKVDIIELIMCSTSKVDIHFASRKYY